MRRFVTSLVVPMLALFLVVHPVSVCQAAFAQSCSPANHCNHQNPTAQPNHASPHNCCQSACLSDSECSTQQLALNSGAHPKVAAMVAALHTAGIVSNAAPAARHVSSHAPPGRS